MKCANELCNIDFEPKHYNQKYCTRVCQNRQGSRRFKQNNKSECQICGKEIDIRYKKCKSCANRKEYSDWANVTIKEMSDKRSYQIHSHVRGLARSKYKRENRFNPNAFQCAVCGYENHIEICHIKAISDFTEDATIDEINNINNLIALCPNHHWELDNNHMIIEITP